MTPFQLGPYRITAQLGAGGFATVYRAIVAGDMGFQRDIALKVLHPHLTTGSPEVVKMLADEARLLARMRHPNIINVQWFGQLAHPQSGNVYVLAMEFVDGRPLGGLLGRAVERREEIPQSVIIDIHTDVAKALAYAHDLTDEAGLPLGLVHRDLKPDNVMVSSEGVVKLLDFGIARATDRLATATKTDMTRGTVHYMSPEQVRAAKDIDFRSDLFSFGAMLWECLSGRRLIQADSAVGALYEVADFKIQPALERVSEVLPLAIPVFEKLLAPEPRDRFATTEDLVGALEALRRAVEAPQSTRSYLKQWVLHEARPAPAPAAGTAPSGGSGYGLDLPPTTPLSVSAGTPGPVPLTAQEEGRHIPPTALVHRTPPAAAPSATAEPGPTRPMKPANTESIDVRGVGTRRRGGKVAAVGVVLLLLGLAVLLGPRLFGRSQPGTTGHSGSDPEASPTPSGTAASSVEAQPQPVAPAEPTADPEAPQPLKEAGSPSLPRGTPRPHRAEPVQPTPGTPLAERVEPTPVLSAETPPVAGPSGTVRIAADYGFEAVVGGKRYTEAQARRGISLPPGDHTAHLTCLDCPTDVRGSLEVTFNIGPSEVVRRPVRFDNVDDPTE